MEADEVKAVALKGRKKQWQQNVNSTESSSRGSGDS